HARNPTALSKDANQSRHRRVSVEGLEECPRRPPEDVNQRTAAQSRSGEDVGLAVAVHIAGRHENAAEERVRVGVEAEEIGPASAVEDAHERAAAETRSG